MKVPWPWNKDSHPVRGMCVSSLGPRGGHPLVACGINLIPCYLRMLASPSYSFSPGSMTRVMPGLAG